MPKLEETKVLRDPIHGYIHIDEQVIWDCLNAREFQRLRRIHQLGGVYQVYPTAQHSRFTHSLGVYEIIRRMINEIKGLREELDDFEKIQVLCAGLLHDRGHGPFSHLFENLSHVHHEQMGINILLDPGTQVHQALIKEDPRLPRLVADIIEHTHEKTILSQLISSQLDADRMDYLLRDAYETGTSYGKFDLERVLRTIRVKNGTFCVKESGMHSIEDYIMARYHMYWQVYLHPDSIGYELLIQMFFKRYKEVDPSIVPIFQCMKDGMSLDEFYLMDENRMMTGFQEALVCHDRILQDLAERILDRHLFEWTEDPQIDRTSLKDKEYYYYEEVSESKAYLPYRELDGTQTIWILDTEENLKPLSQCSEIVKALLKMPNTTKKRIYFG